MGNLYKVFIKVVNRINLKFLEGLKGPIIYAYIYTCTYIHTYVDLFVIFYLGISEALIIFTIYFEALAYKNVFSYIRNHMLSCG